MEAVRGLQSAHETPIEMESLPNEILEKILLYLRPYADCKNAMLVCHRWNRVLRQALLLRKSRFERCVDSDKLRWRYESTNVKQAVAHLPAARLAHCAAFVDDFGEYALYVFGGCTASHTAFHDLWTYQLSTNEWQRETARGALPSPKAFATMCAHRGRLVVYGGWTEAPPTLRHRPPLFFNELHIYSLERRTWHAVTTEPRLPFVARHSSSVVRVGGRDWLVVFGGRKFVPADASQTSRSLLDAEGSEEVSADFLLVDLATFAFIVCARDALPPQFTMSSSGAALRFTFTVEPRFGGRPACVDVQSAGAPSDGQPERTLRSTWPIARFGQFQATIDEHHVLLIGGCGGANRVFDDEVWLVSFDTLEAARDAAQCITARFTLRRLTVRNAEAAPRHAFAKAAALMDVGASQRRHVAFLSVPFARGVATGLLLHLLDVTNAVSDGVVSWRSVTVPAGVDELERRRRLKRTSDQLDDSLPLNGRPHSNASFELCLPTLTYARNELLVFGGLRCEAVAWRFNVFPAAVPRAGPADRDPLAGDNRVVNDLIVVSSV